MLCPCILSQVEFEVEPGISDDEAVRLLGEDTGLEQQQQRQESMRRKRGDDRNSGGAANVLRLDEEDNIHRIEDAFTAQQMVSGLSAETCLCTMKSSLYLPDYVVRVLVEVIYRAVSTNILLVGPTLWFCTAYAEMCHRWSGHICPSRVKLADCSRKSHGVLHHLRSAVQMYSFTESTKGTQEDPEMIHDAYADDTCEAAHHLVPAVTLLLSYQSTSTITDSSVTCFPG